MHGRLCKSTPFLLIGLCAPLTDHHHIILPSSCFWLPSLLEYSWISAWKAVEAIRMRRQRIPQLTGEDVCVTCGHMVVPFL
jgi:hypothetical protein